MKQVKMYSFAKIILTCLWAFVLSAIAFPQENVKQWRALFDEIDAGMKGEGLSKKLNADGTLAWGESYILHAYAAMYRATKDEKYIVRALEQLENVMKNRDDKRRVIDAVRGRILPAWGSVKYSGGRFKGKNHVWVVHTGMITYPMTLVVEIIRSDPRLYKRYGKRADRLLRLVRESVDCHDEDFRQGLLSF